MAPGRFVMPAPVDEQVQVQLPSHGAVLPFGLRGPDGTSKPAVLHYFLSPSINACKVAERSASASVRMTSTRLKADHPIRNPWAFRRARAQPLQAPCADCCQNWRLLAVPWRIAFVMPSSLSRNFAHHCTAAVVPTRMAGIS